MGTAEILGHFVEQALAAGALDVFHTPIQMKKNRPGVLLTLLCPESDADKFTELMLRETTTFGIRRHTCERRKLHREFSTAQTPYGEVKIKIGKLDGKILHATPEFESCKSLADRATVPLRIVFDAAIKSLKGPYFRSARLRSGLLRSCYHVSRFTQYVSCFTPSPNLVASN